MHIDGHVYITYPYQCTCIWVSIYRNETDPGYDGTVTEQTSIPRVLLTQRCYFYINEIVQILNKKAPFSMKSDNLIVCRKCSLNRKCD